MSWKPNRRYGSVPSTVHEGDIMYMTGTGREVRVLDCHTYYPYSLLVKPTDDKVFYRRNDGVDIMQAWWGYERVCHDREEALRQ